MRALVTTICGMMAVTSVLAEIPAGYYDKLDGKSGDALADAIAAMADGHSVVTYNTKTWNAFEKTDVRVIDGKECWWDMYSNNIVWLPAHDALNIEHSVANSWWGGKNGSTEAYSDLFHLNPSDQNANNRKSNNPMGEVADARLLDNGLTRIGTPKEGFGGGSAIVFEPADEYKGDFARAYLYIFSSYSDISWSAGTDKGAGYMLTSDYRLQPWAAEMLLRWNEADPVDDKEIRRNEEIYKLQNNRNPFIDYPQLASFIWGDRKGEAFNLAAESPAAAVNRPAAPTVPDAWLTAVNTYSRRWWDGFSLSFNHDGDRLMLSIDGREYYEPSDFFVDGADSAADRHTYKAYVTSNVNGMILNSPVTTVTLTALDPYVTDYSQARWEKVQGEPAALDDGYYIILSSNTLHPMSTDGGVSSTQFMNEAGFAHIDDKGLVTELQPNTAIVRFNPSGEGRYSMQICDIHGEALGFWNATAKNKMKLDDLTFTPATPEVNEKGEFVFTFTQFGSLQFNKTQPRFLNYESKQTPVYLYKFKDWNGGMSGIKNTIETSQWSVGVDGNDIIAPQGALIFNLNGSRVDGKALTPGIYIVTGNGRSVKVRL